MKFQFSTVLLALALIFTLNSCGQKNNSSEAAPAENTEEMDDSGAEAEAIEETPEGKEYASAYICPMHCEGSGSEEAGVCPVCGMDYVMNKKLEETEHDHEGHSH